MVRGTETLALMLVHTSDLRLQPLFFLSSLSCAVPITYSVQTCNCHWSAVCRVGICVDCTDRAIRAAQTLSMQTTGLATFPMILASRQRASLQAGKSQYIHADLQDQRYATFPLCYSLSSSWSSSSSDAQTPCVRSRSMRAMCSGLSFHLVTTGCSWANNTRCSNAHLRFSAQPLMSHGWGCAIWWR